MRFRAVKLFNENGRRASRMLSQDTDDLDPGFNRIFGYLREFHQLALAVALWIAYRKLIEHRVTGKEFPLVRFKA